jgi:hypothetical protein
MTNIIPTLPTEKVRKYLYVVGIALLIGTLGYGFGRYSAPIQIKEVEKIKIVTVEKKVENTKEKKDVQVVVVQKPDGTTTTTTTDKTTIDIAASTNTDTTSLTDKSKLTVFSRPSWKFTLMGGMDIHTSNLTVVKPIYGGMIERSILGPISIGAWGISNGTFGLSAAIAF